MSPKQSDAAKQTTKQKIASVAAIACAAVVAVGSSLYFSDFSSNELVISAKVNGNDVGFVSSLSDMENAYNKLCLTANTASEGLYNPNLQINFDYEYAKSPEYLTKDGCFEALWSQIESDFCTAYVLYVDDRLAGAHESKEELDNLISSIESELLESIPDEFSDIEISNRIRIEQKLCLKSTVKTLEEINSLLNPLVNEKLSKANSDIIKVRVASMEAAAPLTATDDNDLTLDYNLLNTVTLSEPIPFDTQIIEDFDNYIGTETVVNEGKDGVKSVTYEIIYDADGNYIGKTAIDSRVIEKAVNKIVLAGAVEIPDSVPTGTFIWPCDRPKGVSSYYGWRDLYGRPDFHLGIDIPDVKGSKIWAADGGTVIFAGHTPSYGYNVHVLHADGFSTLYAHLDSMCVEVGDELYIGQQIGTMGATGVAYGTHLHFEVRINNKTVDPINYLPKE